MTRSLIICTVQNVIRIVTLRKVEMWESFSKYGKNRTERVILKHICFEEVIW